MIASQLVTYLCEVPVLESNIEISRELLAKNMNFSPAWLLSLMKLKNSNLEQFVRVQDFGNFCEMVQFDISSHQVVQIFMYFDFRKNRKISCSQFVELLLPSKNQALRKTVLKRIADNLELSFDLKYALKKMLTQILCYQEKLKSYEKMNHDFDRVFENKSQEISEKQLKGFLSFYGRYPDENQIKTICKLINDGRLNLSAREIKKIIQQSQRKIKIQQNQLRPLVANNNENRFDEVESPIRQIKTKNHIQMSEIKLKKAESNQSSEIIVPYSTLNNKNTFESPKKQNYHRTNNSSTKNKSSNRFY